MRNTDGNGLDSISLDATTLAKQVVSLRLVTDVQLQQCSEEISDNSHGGEVLLRALERKGYVTPLQIEKLKKGDLDGYFLGGYRLLYKIASGSFGRVYRGDDPQNGRIVAIKILRKRWSDSPASVDLFEREAKVGMSLRHPNIVETLAVARDLTTRQYYMVMEFVEGGNLRDFLGVRKKLEPLEALRLMEEMVSGLSYAAAKGVTHRDIKLTNILISSQGTAKLVDFGLAQIYSSSKGRSSDDENVQRTVDYAGLEMATGVPSGDPRSDIYFLGCVLYEMLTGRPPLPLTRNRHARMQKERFEKVQPIRPDEVNGPASVLRLVETMMALKPERRYQVPAKILDAINEARLDLSGDSGRPVATGPLSAESSRTVFLIERDAKLQSVIRDKLKNMGYRVLVAGDPGRAIDRFNQEPFACLIVDVGTTFEDGIALFHRILEESRGRNIPCGKVLLFSEDQQHWRDDLPQDDLTTVLVRPLKLGELIEKVEAFAPVSR